MVINGTGSILVQMQSVYTAIRTSQLEAYSWYEKIKGQLNAAATSEELETIYPIKTY